MIASRRAVVGARRLKRALSDRSHRYIVIHVLRDSCRRLVAGGTAGGWLERGMLAGHGRSWKVGRRWKIGMGFRGGWWIM